MAKNIINQKDKDVLLDIARDMAKDYNITLEEFGELIMKEVLANESGELTMKKKSVFKHQMRLNDQEYKIVEDQARGLVMNISEYCRSCFRKGRLNNIIRNNDIFEIKKDAYSRRDKRILIIFYSIEDYNYIKKISKEYNLNMSSTMRYFALTIKL